MSKSFKNISVVAVATLVSRFLGLGRDILITAVFGLGSLASAFYTAFTLPNLFRRLLGEGALTAAFVPTLSEEMRRGDRASAFALVNTVTSWLFVVTGTLVAGSMAAIGLVTWVLPDVTGWGIDADRARRWLEAADFAIILFPYLLCVCLAAAFSAALQTLGRFLEPALSPIWLNVSMIALLAGAAYGGWASTDEEKMLWLCGGALLGGLLQLTVPAAALARQGWRPRFDLSVNDPLRQIVRLMVPTLFGSAIYLINMAVSRFIGLSLNESAVAVLNLATRLMELPIGVFTIAVSTVVFPLIAKYAAAGDTEQVTTSYRKGMRLILVINVPAAVGLLVLATPIIRLLFQRGEFGALDTLLMRPVLMVCALGLPFISFVSIVLRGFYAHKDTRTPVRAALVSFFVNLGLSLTLMGPLGTVGLAIASNVAVMVQAIYLQVQLTKKYPALAFSFVRSDLLKILTGAAIMGVVVAGGWELRQGFFPPAKVADAVAVVGLIFGGALVYAGLVWMLRIEGRDDLRAVVTKLAARVGL